MKVINREAEFFYPHGGRNSELAVYHYGKHANPTGNAGGPDVREYYLLHFIVSGKGTYRCGGRKWSLAAGDVFLIKPGEETYYKADDKDPWDYFFVAFHGSRAKELVDAVHWVDGYIYRPSDFESLKKKLRELYSVKVPDEGGGTRSSAYCISSSPSSSPTTPMNRSRPTRSGRRSTPRSTSSRRTTPRPSA